MAAPVDSSEVKYLNAIVFALFVKSDSCARGGHDTYTANLTHIGHRRERSLYTNMAEGGSIYSDTQTNLGQREKIQRNR